MHTAKSLTGEIPHNLEVVCSSIDPALTSQLTGCNIPNCIRCKFDGNFSLTDASKSTADTQAEPT